MTDVGYITLLKVGVKHVTASLLARQAAWGGGGFASSPAKHTWHKLTVSPKYSSLFSTDSHTLFPLHL